MSRLDLSRSCRSCLARPGEPCRSLLDGEPLDGVHKIGRGPFPTVNRPTMTPEPNRPETTLEEPNKWPNK